jgi:3-dehydroquinate synthase
LGFISQTDADIIKNVIKKAHLPVELHDVFTDFDCDSAISMMMQDKKVTDGKATFILMQDIGKAFIAKNTDMQAVKNFLLEKTHKM